MDVSIILADLRARHGDKSVLTATDIARELGRPTANAIYSLNDRGGLPFPLLEDTKTPCASIYAVADWLAGKSTLPKKSPVKSTSETPVKPDRSRRRESLAKYILAVKRQRDFLEEFYPALEAELIALEAAETTQTNEDVAKGGRL
jgi:hypothetical protein